jgi:hypothetical protein
MLKATLDGPSAKWEFETEGKNPREEEPIKRDVSISRYLPEE